MQIGLQVCVCAGLCVVYLFVEMCVCLCLERVSTVYYSIGLIIMRTDLRE